MSSDFDDDGILELFGLPADEMQHLVPHCRDSPVRDQQQPPAKHLTGDGSLLDTALTAMWEECLADGLFRYDLSTTSTKVIPGKLGLIAQLNLGRATMKRPTEFRVDQVGMRTHSVLSIAVET